MEDVPRLSDKEALILGMLIGRGEMYGLEMVESSGGRLKRGTVYVTLSRMEEKGFVTSRQEAQPRRAGLPRRLYEPTGLGHRVLAAREAAHAAFSPAQAIRWSIGASCLLISTPAWSAVARAMAPATDPHSTVIGELGIYIGSAAAIGGILGLVVLFFFSLLFFLAFKPRRVPRWIPLAQSLIVCVLAPFVLVIEHSYKLGYPFADGVLRFLTVQGRGPRHNENPLYHPPGQALDKFAEFVFSPDTYRSVFSPLIGDLHHEYFKALAAHRHRKAAWICFRYRFIFCSTVFAQVPVSVTRILFALWKAAGS